MGGRTCLFLSPRLQWDLAAYFLYSLSKKTSRPLPFQIKYNGLKFQRTMERQQFSAPHEENPLHLGSIKSAANFFSPANFEVQVTSVFNSFFPLK